jgi:hypothetical protein
MENKRIFSKFEFFPPAETQLEREFSNWTGEFVELHKVLCHFRALVWRSCGRKSVIEARSVVRRSYNKQIIYWARRLQQVAAAAALDAAGDVLWLKSRIPDGALR